MVDQKKIINFGLTFGQHFAINTPYFSAFIYSYLRSQIKNKRLTLLNKFDYLYFLGITQN
jgi:hypothetical protein